MTSTSIQEILIYAGHAREWDKIGDMKSRTIEKLLPCIGPWYESVEQHYKMMNDVKKAENKDWKVYLIYGQEIRDYLLGILKEKKAKQTVFVLSAGPSTLLDKTFTCKQYRIIRHLIAAGGHFFTTCGGAYVTSRSRTWNNITKKGYLNLFNGTAMGPRYPRNILEKDEQYFHDSVDVKILKGIRVCLLLSGGGTYIPEKKDNSSKNLNENLRNQKVEIIAEYCDNQEIKSADSSTSDETQDADPNVMTNSVQEKPYNMIAPSNAAAILATYGKGLVLLNSVNPGYGPNDINLSTYSTLFPDHDWQHIIETLSSKKDRIQFSCQLMQALEKGIILNPDSSQDYLSGVRDFNLALAQDSSPSF